jgi:hypothetical protein
VFLGKLFILYFCWCFEVIFFVFFENMVLYIILLSEFFHLRPTYMFCFWVFYLIFEFFVIFENVVINILQFQL